MNRYQSLPSFSVALVAYGMMLIIPAILLLHAFDEIRAAYRRWRSRSRQDADTLEAIDALGPFQVKPSTSSLRRLIFHRVRAIRYPTEGRVAPRG